MPKVEPFYAQCSSENCGTVGNQVMGSYDKVAHKKKPMAHMKGGLDMRVLEPAQVPILGERGTYTVKRHGLGIEFRRCYEFAYVDKYRHKATSDTCTKKLNVNIPQRTLDCYQNISALLKTMQKGKKGRPGINRDVIALVACSKSGVSPTRVSEPMSPAIVATVLGLPQYAVRKAMENMIKSRQLVTAETIDVINEKQVRLPPSFQQAFDDFIRTEQRERLRAGMRRVFEKGADVEAVSPDLPESDRFTIYKPTRFAPKKLGEKKLERFRREAEEWKERTGIVRPGMRQKKPSKIKHVPKKTRDGGVELEQALSFPGGNV